MKKFFKLPALVAVMLMVVSFFVGYSMRQAGRASAESTPCPLSSPSASPSLSPTPTPSAAPSYTYAYNFSSPSQIEEAGSMSGSSNPNWWVSSGGYMYNNAGIGSTVLGSLPAGSKWQVAYASSNPTDTDNGYHPQNIFRLVTKSKWQNYQQQAYFNIQKDNLSASSNRNQSNGILLFNRYQDQNNLYYTGIRVDGYAVIKKKINGTYYTMDYKLLPGMSGTYNRSSNPDMLPKNTWIGLRSVVTNNSNGTVSIKLYMDKGRTGQWTLVAQATDNGSTYGPIISNQGYAGLRTDFMDVKFSDYSMLNL